MVAQLAEFVSRVLPYTVGDGKPVYRQPFVSSQNPSEALNSLVMNTQQVYHINPYLTEPSHDFVAQG